MRYVYIASILYINNTGEYKAAAIVFKTAITNTESLEQLACLHLHSEIVDDIQQIVEVVVSPLNTEGLIDR